MAFDAALAGRIREALPPDPSLTEKAMFGGIAWLRAGNMFIGIVGDELMVRVGKPNHAQALTAPHVRPMDFSGRPMEGYIYVAAVGCASVDQIRPWVDAALTFVSDAQARGEISAPKPRKPAKAR